MVAATWVVRMFGRGSRDDRGWLPAVLAVGPAGSPCGSSGAVWCRGFLFLVRWLALLWAGEDVGCLCLEQHRVLTCWSRGWRVVEWGGHPSAAGPIRGWRREEAWTCCV
jgi:hypothetical protein